MQPHSSNRARRLGVVSAFVALLTSVPGAAPPHSPAGQSAAPPSAQSAGPSALPIDVVVLDRDGKPVDGLGPDQFTVTVDGAPRRVLWVRHVSRGPGAVADAASRQAGRSETLSFAAEPARNVLIVIDELSIQRGAERAAVQAAAALVDRLGLDDRVAVLRIPIVRDAQLALTTERPEVRAALREVVGQASRAAARPADDFTPDRQNAGAADPDRVVADPDRTTAVQTERPPTEALAAPKAGDEGAAPSGLVPSLQAVLTSLRSSPGRKAVFVFSAGVPPAGASGVDAVALAASASHGVLYAFGLSGARDDPEGSLDAGALDRMTRATGGSFTALGRNPEKVLDRVLPELSACYVLGIEPAATDLDGRRHALRVVTARPAASVRAPAVLVDGPDSEDVVPPPPAPKPGKAGVVYIGGAPGAGAATPDPSARELEARPLVARAADYVAGYQREYSMLVAEERYVQRTKTEQRTLRSDLLLVRPPGLDSWVSFRDVFEVNGRPVRDREDRLKRLFLDGSPEAQKQLAAIKEESSRLNIGQVERNINVPLYALKFLEAANLARCRFEVSGSKEVGGVQATRITFRETATPTLVRRDGMQDLAATGWFLVDPASGAVVGTMLQLAFPRDDAVFEFTVRYERDEDLGLWVPGEMTEVYSARGTTMGAPSVVGARGSSGSLPIGGTSLERSLVLDARAEYSRFRRFQVQSQTEIKIAK